MPRKPPADSRESVTRVEVKDARRLITIGPDDPAWKRENVLVTADAVGGAIVRLKPPPDARDEVIASIRARCEAVGVARVIVLPRPRSEEIPENRPRRGSGDGAREAVTALALESAESAALLPLCEQVMGEEGL